MGAGFSSSDESSDEDDEDSIFLGAGFGAGFSSSDESDEEDEDDSIFLGAGLGAGFSSSEESEDDEVDSIFLGAGFGAGFSSSESDEESDEDDSTFFGAGAGFSSSDESEEEEEEEEACFLGAGLASSESESELDSTFLEAFFSSFFSSSSSSSSFSSSSAFSAAFSRMMVQSVSASPMDLICVAALWRPYGLRELVDVQLRREILEEGVDLLAAHVAELAGEHLEDAQRDLDDAEGALQQQDVPEALRVLEVHAAREERVDPVAEDHRHVHLVLLEGAAHVGHLLLHGGAERRAVLLELVLHLGVHRVAEVLREQVHRRRERALLVLELQQHRRHVVQPVEVADVRAVRHERLQQLLQVALKPLVVERALLGEHVYASQRAQSPTLHRLGDLQNGLLVSFGGGVGVLRVSEALGDYQSELLAKALSVLDVHAVQLRGDAHLRSDHHVPALRSLHISEPTLMRV